MKNVASKPRGARAGRPDTKGAILGAARALFVEHGYEGTTLRAVATAADVDVALIAYHFKSKEGLFAAAMQLDINPADVVAGLLAQGIDGIGERLVRGFVTVWDSPTGGPLIAMIRSAATHSESAEMLRGFVQREILGRVAEAIDADQPELRAALAGSQMVGLAMARYIVGIEPVASADPEVLVAAIGPTIDRYLTGDVAGLPDGARANRPAP